MIATVEGVLEHNKKIRDDMLKHNMGKYSQWPFALNPAIGDYYNIDYNRQLSDLKNGKGLLSFTHDGDSTYSEEIKRKFFSSKEEEPYFVSPLTYSELNPWIEFQNGSYIQYIDEVFGKDDVMRHVDYVNNLLSGQFIENALRQTDVGVIKDINVAVALQGIVTTNPNNMSGEDTIMGKISNRMYAQTLYNGAIFNSDRMKAKIHDGENYYQKAYLTPSLINQYGNNLANLYELSDIMKIGTNETHIREDLGGDVSILDGYKGNIANLTLPQFRILNEQIQNAINEGRFSKNSSGKTIVNYDGILPRRMYTIEEHYGYVNAVKDTHAFRFGSFSEVNEKGTFLAENNSSSGRISGRYNMLIYNEGESGYKANPNDLERDDDNVDEFNIFDNFSVINGSTTGVEDLMYKTNILFRRNEIDTLIGRFHTSKDEYKYPEFTDTARSAFGNSHGRNLLVRDALEKKPTTNGYSNPYCRTWTYHHQYNQVKKLIRPFTNEVNGVEVPYKSRDIQSMNKKYRAYRSTDGENAIFGYQSLGDNTVLQENGFVKITPKSGEGGIDVRKCMFSIENLAWKDVLPIDDNISKEQRGPNGGRIMWFPPYDLDFQEGVNVEWNQNTFIGRGEKVYTYTNTERTGTLSFSLLIDHPAIINSVTKNAYEGMGREKDPEADILRFFAGCELLEEPDKLVSPESAQQKGTPTTEFKEGKIVFKIYYPNNFTGIVSDSKDCKGDIIYNDFSNYVLETNDGIWRTVYNPKFKNDYWWQYILVGNNTCVPVNKEYFRGYEMMSPSDNGNGLTNDTEYTNDPLPICKDNKCIVHPKPLRINDDAHRNTCANGIDESEKYYYQVDEDLHQKLRISASYKDTTSFQLNANFTEIDEIKKHQDFEYTFAEVMMALLKYNEGKGDYGSLYNLYKDYVIGELKVDNSRIQVLVDLFKNDDVVFTGVSYRGSADNNDKDNSLMLARRRAFTGYEMLKRLFNKLNNTSLETQPGIDTGGETNTLACSKGQKINRFCEFTITYKIPAKDLKDTAGDKGVADNGNNSSGTTSGDTTQITFEDYMNAIVAYSPSISAYIALIMGPWPYPVYDMAIDNGKLKQALESRFNKLPNKNKIDLTDETFLKTQVDEIIETDINRESLILAYAVADDETCGAFRVLCGENEYVKIQDIFGKPVIKPHVEYEGYKYLRFIFAYLIGEGAKEPDYKPDGEFEYQFTYNIPEKLYKYKDVPTGEIYTISMDKILMPVVLGHYIQDNYNNFGIATRGSKKDIMPYLYDFCELIYMDTPVPMFVEDKLVLERTNLDYDYWYNLIFNTIVTDDEEEDGTVIPSVVSKLNEKIFEEDEKELKKEQGQQIQEQRPDTEENKAEKQEEKKTNDIAMVYGRDENIPNMRYESEGEYFENIKITDPLLFKNLKDKFKYFNPAYHSISPEGFNARLTFLQQCTRQGQTCEIGSNDNNASNGYTKTASNLAFGRMPVCVIRIGDFINTRAIINNMSISYAAANGIVWDLNSEGAGVQPMYAKISLGITLLGGQSLGAPISRLQNAISFNYYANAEAYDNRADVATYEENEKGGYNVSYKRLWTPFKKGDNIPTNDNVMWESMVEKKQDDMQNETFKQPTEEQFADKLKKPETSGSTSGATEEDEIVSSQRISYYVNEQNGIKQILSMHFVPLETFEHAFVTVKCNKRYEESDYKRSEYKENYISYFIAGNISPRYSEDIKKMIFDELNNEIMAAVRQFRDSHDGSGSTTG